MVGVMDAIKRKMILPVALVVGMGFCTVQREPEPVGNLRGKIVNLSKSLLGIPYHYGGSDIEGFDCSGLVHYVYSAFGIQVPRTAKAQARLKNRLPLKWARPGDILVFKLKGGFHTGIYVNKKYFIHAPSRGEQVRRERLDAFWRRKFKWLVSLLDRG
jgi:cell wall-associated NlpC family hydrolase